MSVTITMAPRLGLDAVGPLVDNISAASGQDLELDASQVSHLGTLCLQVLLAAARDWAITGRRFRLVSPSDACTTQLALFGLSPETLAGGTA